MTPNLSAVDLPLRRQLESPKRNIDYVYFPTSGFASVVAKGSRSSIEVGIIGREGMTGLAVIMGATRTDNATFMQSPGAGMRISADNLRTAMAHSPTLRLALLRAGHAFTVQVSATVLSNSMNKIEERLARWLLMAHDRGDSDSLHLTHEFLAMMLGVRRAGVTIALGSLVHKGLITLRRGYVTILDRKFLMQTSNGAYSMVSIEAIH